MSEVMTQIVKTLADLREDVRQLQRQEFPLGAVTINDSVTGYQLKLANGSGNVTFSINAGGAILDIQDINYVRFTNSPAGSACLLITKTDAGEWRFGCNTAEDFQVKDQIAGTTPFYIVDGSETNLLYLKAGKVGVGVNDPATRLHVYHATDDVYLHVETGGTNGVASVAVRNDAQVWQFRLRYDDTLAIYDGTNTKAIAVFEPDALANSLTFVGTTATWADTLDFVFGTTTGSKIGTAAAQKIGFYGATPVNQRQKANYNNWATLANVVAALVDLGLFDQT